MERKQARLAGKILKMKHFENGAALPGAQEPRILNNRVLLMQEEAERPVRLNRNSRNRPMHTDQCNIQ